MTAITDLPRVYSFNHVLTADVECYAHESGLFLLYSHDKGLHVTIDPIGMTEDEIERAMAAGDTIIARSEPAPVNRAERRAALAAARRNMN